MRGASSISQLPARREGERRKGTACYLEKENVRGWEHLETVGVRWSHREVIKAKREKNRRNPSASPSSFWSLSYRPSLCLHLHSALNKVLRDTWQVARRGAEFQSGPSEFRRTDGGQRWRGSLKRNFIPAAHSVHANAEEAKEQIIYGVNVRDVYAE